MFDILRKMNTVAFTSAWKLPYVLPHSPVGGNLTCSSSSSTSWAGSYTSTSFRNLSLLYASQNSRKKQQQTRRIRCGVVQEIDEGKFSDVVLKSDRPVLVEFVATWCGPCRLIAPAVESLAQEYEEKLAVVKIDHDSNPRLIEEYKVYGLPTLILFKDGKEVPDSRREGAITKVKLKEYVDALLQSVSVA